MLKHDGERWESTTATRLIKREMRRFCAIVIFCALSVAVEPGVSGESQTEENQRGCNALPLVDRVLQEESESKDKRKVFKKLTKWSKNGCAEATYALIPFYMGGHGPADLDQKYAVELAKTSAENGFVRAQLQMGKFYMWGYDGLPRDGQSAVGWFRRAAEGGSTTAITNLIQIYESGKLGVEKDEEKVEYWRKRKSRE